MFIPVGILDVVQYALDPASVGGDSIGYRLGQTAMEMRIFGRTGLEFLIP
jgi:hypothetical protein